jgi:transcriptional regulator with XRE-family HTH domain
MHETFGTLLKRYLDREGMSQMDLARSVNTSSSVVSEVQHDKRPPPLPRIDAWADALGLVGQERLGFLREALLAHCPEPIRDEMRTLRATVAKLQRLVDDMKDRR